MIAIHNNYSTGGAESQERRKKRLKNDTFNFNPRPPKRGTTGAVAKKELDGE